MVSSRFTVVNPSSRQFSLPHSPAPNTLYVLVVIPQASHPSQPWQLFFCLSGFACFGHFIKMEPYHKCPLCLASLLSTLFSRVIRIIARISTSFLFMAEYVVLYGKTVFRLSTHQWMGIGSSPLLPLWMALLGTFLYTFLCAHVLISQGHIPRGGIAGSYCFSFLSPI